MLKRSLLLAILFLAPLKAQINQSPVAGGGGGGDASEATLATRLGEATYTGRTGEVQASPTAYTVLGRLKAIEDALALLLTELGAKTEPADTQTVSGTVGISGSVAVTGPLTDTQLRATPVPVSGTFYQATQPVSGTVGVSGSVAVTGPLTDTELRATPVPVSGTFYQATQPVSAASLPLPSNAAQETGGNLASIVTNTGRIPSQGQALAAASLPVVLPAAQISTLTPLSSVGVSSVPSDPFGANADAASSTGSISAKLRYIAGTGIPVTSLPSVTGTVTANAGTNLNTSLLALESGGNLASVVTNTGRIPAQGQALMAASTPVAIASNQSAIPASQSGTWNIGTVTTLTGITNAVTANATLSAETTKVIGTVNVAAGQTIATTNAGTFAVQPASATAPVSTMNSASANSGVNVANAMVFDDTSPTSITENSFGFQRMSANRNAYTTIRDAAGNERGANVDANSNLGVVLPAETTKVLGTIRVQGNVGGVMDAANNASAPANVLVAGFEAATQGSTQPTAATAGNVRRAVISTDGALYVRQGGPVNFTCSADNIGNTLTQLTGCAGAGAGLKYYITDIIAQSTTSTGGQWLLRTGTGTNCGTGTASILPSAATAARFSAPANTSAATSINFVTPIATAANVQVCVLGVGTNTTTIQINGYIAP